MSELYDKLKFGEITPAQYQKKMRKIQLKSLGFEREIDYRDEKAREEGYESLIDKMNKKAQLEGYKSFADKQKCKAQKEGFKNHPDKIAKKMGLSGEAEYVRNKRHALGINKPMEENIECSAFFGCCVGEPLLEIIYKTVERMPYGMTGYDYVCNKKYKFDVKSMCLDTKKRWHFNILKNKIADIFLLLGFDNRYDMNLLHVWRIKGNNRIKNKNGTKLMNEKTTLSIWNTTRSLTDFYEYEITYELEKDGKLDKVKEKIEETKKKYMESKNKMVI